MTFLEHMQVSPSKNDIELRIRLYNRGLRESLMPLDTVILFTDPPQIVLPEDFTRHMTRNGANMLKEAKIPFTVPDALIVWNSRPKLEALPIYLDGPVHRRRGVKNRDDKITKRLTDAGIPPLRFETSARISVKGWAVILEGIEEHLK